MSKYIRGDLLIYTNKGLKRLDKLNKEEYLLKDEKNNNVEINEIIRCNLKNFYLYKIKTIHNIDNYYLDGYNKIFCIQNIPYELKINECKNFIEDNTRICSPSFINIKDITEFDFIGFPFTNNEIEDISQDEIDKYRFYGIILLINTKNISLNNNLNKNTIGFLNKYLHNNNIPFEIFNNNITSNIKFDIPVLSIDELYNLSYTNTLHLIKGFCEINSVINTTNKEDFYLLKNIFIKVGILLSVNYIQNNYIIKIPNPTDSIDNNFFIYNNNIWSKIKKITKTEKLTNGQLYCINTLNKSKFLTEIGLIE